MELLKSIRQTLHKHPELSGNEKETAQRIKEFLCGLNKPKIYTDIGGHGIILHYNFNDRGPTILVRGDMDALPIEEQSDTRYKSENLGVSHACGHDGHSTILIGLARELEENALPNGNIYLVFQPAEETGEGALQMIQDEFFKNLNIDYALALHNIPGYPQNEIIIRNNAFTCAVTSMIIQFHGKESHAAEPEYGINPALALSEVIQKINSLQSPQKTKDYKIITPVHVSMGEKAYGTSAGNAEYHITLRSWSQAKLEELITEIKTELSFISSKYSIKIISSLLQSFQTNNNSVEVANYIRNAAKKLNLNIMEKETPFTWGEDFGVFTQKYKGAMFGLGAGKQTPNLHNPSYDFPDEIIETGVQMFYTILSQLTEQ